jgi:hypothetical protein
MFSGRAIYLRGSLHLAILGFLIFRPSALLSFPTVDRSLMWGRVLAHCLPHRTRV